MTVHRQIICMAAAILAGLGAGEGAAGAATLTNGRVSMTIDDPTLGLSVKDADRVDSISWINSAGQSTGNLVANSDSQLYCNDPYEYFGQADGFPVQQSSPILVTYGEYSKGHVNSGRADNIRTSGKVCSDALPVDARAVTRYGLNPDEGRISSVKIERVFLFGPATPIFAQPGLRAYMPRVSEYSYPIVKLPDSTGKITTYKVSRCSDGCQVTDWNGTWIADDDGNGNGLALIRSYKSTNPAFVVIDNDDYSQSNASSIVLAQPANGWTAPVTEMEYLCFYDATSWPKSKQKKGKLPEGCAVK